MKFACPKLPIKVMIITIMSTLLLSGCLKSKTEENSDGTEVKKKTYEPNISKKAEKAAGGGFIIGGPRKTEYEFSKANPIWRASLLVLEDIPINSANYAGGIISTDWYSTENSSESLKIQIVFYENKVRASAFTVQGFKKSCSGNSNCKTFKTSKNFNDKIKKAIIDKTREISILEEEKKK